MIPSDQQSNSILDEAIQAEGASSAGVDTALSEIRKAIEARLVAVRKLTKEVDDLEAAYKALLRQKQMEDGRSVERPRANFAKRQRERRSSLAWQVRQEASRILSEAGRPLTRSELLTGLINSGIYVGKDDPAKKVGKIMWDAKEFRHTGAGYWFSDAAVESLTERFHPTKTAGAGSQT
jgi:hypothetical protein